MSKKIYVAGYGSDIAGANAGSAAGAYFLQNSRTFHDLQKSDLTLEWHTIIEPDTANTPKLSRVINMAESLANWVENQVNRKHFFAVFGGDHSSAIGTWSGAYAAVRQQGELGLIWIDAHMDSHTPESSGTGNIHGMPLACLLGFGEENLTKLLVNSAKLKPENICLIGVRSYEAGEAELLNQLNVRIFYMSEIQQKGLDVVMDEAIQIVTRNTCAFGVSLDVDAIDPIDAPGTGVAEKDGLNGKDLCSALEKVAVCPDLIGIEIVEFDPTRDTNSKTEILISELLKSMVIGKSPPL